MNVTKEIELAEALIERGRALITQGTERLKQLTYKSCEGLSAGNTTPRHPKGLKTLDKTKLIEKLRK